MAKSKMVPFTKLKNEAHGPQLVEFKPWRSVIPSITTPMITIMGEKDLPGNRLGLGFAHIAKAEELGGPSHKHPHDQWIGLFGTSDDFTDFDADVEFTLDNKVYKINYPFYAFIPAGTYHCPLTVKRLGKPIIFMDARVDDDGKAKPVFKDPNVKLPGEKKTTAKKPAAKKAAGKKSK
jgi:hypothetical protein